MTTCFCAPHKNSMPPCGTAAHAAAQNGRRTPNRTLACLTAPLRRLRNRNRRARRRRPASAGKGRAAPIDTAHAAAPAVGELRLGLEPARPRLRVVFRIGSGVGGERLQSPAITRPAARQAPARSGRASTTGAARAALRSRGRPGRGRNHRCPPCWPRVAAGVVDRRFRLDEPHRS